MDPISDMITRITNAQAVHKDQVFVPFSKLKFRIAQILKDAGYITDVEKRTRKARTAELDWLDISLKYDGTLGAISGTRIISRPSRHIYAKATELKPVRSGFGTAIVSTPKGVMTSNEARKANVGGEILFEIW